LINEHAEVIRKKDVPELANIDADDIHVLDYEEGTFHCAEVFSHEGAFRACAKTKEEAVHKAAELYVKKHS